MMPFYIVHVILKMTHKYLAIWVFILQNMIYF